MKKLVVITGGTKGIGRALIDKFLAGGFDVATCARSHGDLELLEKEVKANFPGAGIYVKPADLSKKTEVLQFAQFIREINRPVEVLINNTGIFIPGMVHNEEDGVLETMMDTNLYSAYHLTRALIGEMMKNKRGDIFNICSVASIKAYPNGGSYAISKFALLGFTKVLREELKESGIRVIAVLPGATLTASWEGVELPATRFMKPEDVADSIWSATQLSRQSVVEEIIIRPQLGDL